MSVKTPGSPLHVRCAVRIASIEVFTTAQSSFLIFHNYCCSDLYSTKYFRIWLVKLKIMNSDHSAPPTPIAWWCRMSGCHLSATELSRLLHFACGTACLTKLHLPSHCVHSGDTWKHSCFNHLFRTSSWHSSGPSNSFFSIKATIKKSQIRLH